MDGKVEYLPYPLPGQGGEKDLRPLPLGTVVGLFWTSCHNRAGAPALPQPPGGGERGL